jgi:hypothetical protein
MKTVAMFLDIQEAHIVKGVLEAEGIPAVVVDENMTSLVIYTPAIGGVRLQVPDEDYDRARRVLGLGEEKEEAPPAETPPGEVCPRCGSGDIRVNPLSPKTVLAFFASLFAGIPVLSRKKVRVCRKCGEKW